MTPQGKPIQALLNNPADSDNPKQKQKVAVNQPKKNGNGYHY